MAWKRPNLPDTTAPERPERPAERVTILSWGESTDAVDTLLDSLVSTRDPRWAPDTAGHDSTYRFGELARLLARLALVRADHTDAETAGCLPFGVHERPFVAYVEEYDPAALGIPTDRGYLGVTRGFQAAIAALQVPEKMGSRADTEAVRELHTYALAAWREAQPPIRAASA